MTPEQTRSLCAIGVATGSIPGTPGSASRLYLTLSANRNTALRALKFCVGTTAFEFTDSATNSEIWPDQGLSWALGEQVPLSISSPCLAPSSGPNLRGLTASSAAGTGGMFSTPDTGTFSASMASCAATVPEAEC